MKIARIPMNESIKNNAIALAIVVVAPPAFRAIKRQVRKSRNFDTNATPKFVETLDMSDVTVIHTLSDQ